MTDARQATLTSRARLSWREHLTGPAVVAGAVAVCALLDMWLSGRAATGRDTAEQLAPLYSYIGVGPTYILARAAGMTALVTAWLAVAAGLWGARPLRAGVHAPSRLPGAHRALSLVTIALVAAHATVPYYGVFPPLGGWSTATVPFAQPYAWGTTAQWGESAGIIAVYLMVLLGPTYYLARRWRHGWRTAHRLALATYLLAVAHTLVLGSDFLVAGHLRTILIGAQIPLLILLARSVPRRAAFAVWTGAVAVAAITIFGALGSGLGGFPLQGAG